MKRILTLATLIMTFMVVKADLGEPTIQAICKITLTNGEIVEGFTTLGIGGYNGIWTNGFYFEQGENYKNPVLFSLLFKSIEMTEPNTYSVKDGIGGGLRFKRNQKFYYMEWEKTPSIYEPNKVKLKSSDSILSLIISSNLEKKYKLLDTITVYLELPSSTYLNSNEKVKNIKVAIKDIVKFEFVSNPSEQWISEIKEKNIKANEKYNGHDSSGDFWEASWYHDIIKDDRLLKKYQESIIFNNRR